MPGPAAERWLGAAATVALLSVPHAMSLYFFWRVRKEAESMSRASGEERLGKGVISGAELEAGLGLVRAEEVIQGEKR